MIHHTTSCQALKTEIPKGFAEPGDDGLVFVGPLGGRLRRSNFRDTWLGAIAAAGLPGLHLHDLRHTGNTMAAATDVLAS